MKKDLLSLKKIKCDLKNAKNSEELYQLLQSYNAYSILLLKARDQYNEVKTNFEGNSLSSDCYEKCILDLFSQFKNDECIIGKLSEFKTKDMLFLIDMDTLLRINSSYSLMSSKSISLLKYELLKINNCVGKIYNQRIFCRDPYYCDTHYEEKKAFGLFNNGKLVTPGYVLDEQFKVYDNIDIRKIINTKSISEIYEKITVEKDEKIRELSLVKHKK